MCLPGDSESVRLTMEVTVAQPDSRATLCSAFVREPLGPLVLWAETLEAETSDTVFVA